MVVKQDRKISTLFIQKFVIGFYALTFLVSAIGSNTKTYQIDPNTIKSMGIELSYSPVKAIQFTDVSGDYLIVLLKHSSISRQLPNPEREEYHQIKVINFKKSGQSWINQWEINDFIDCPTLDSELDFFLDNVDISDVNKDGIYEVSIPYHMFCGGGVDPSIIKIIMRTGKSKFAIRGNSKIIIPGVEPMGGELTIDSALYNKKNIPFREQLLKIWHEVYLEKNWHLK